LHQIKIIWIIIFTAYTKLCNTLFNVKLLIIIG
jgi:hypothetical protein